MTTHRLDPRRVPGIGWVLLVAGIALLACTSGEDAPPPAPSPTAASAAATPRATATSAPPTAAPATATPTPTSTPFPTPEPAYPPGPPASGVSTVWSGAAQGTGAPWFTCLVTPGADPEVDDWTVEVGATTAVRFSCRPQRDGDGLRLTQCSGLPEGYAFSAEQSAGDPETLDVNFVQPAFGGQRSYQASLTQAWVRDEATASTNVELAWQRDASATFGPYTDVWTAGGLTFAPHSGGAIEVLDAETGAELGVIDTADYGPSQGLGTWVADVKSAGSLLYASTISKGILIFDVADPAAPVFVGRYYVPGPSDSLETFSNIHNIYLSPDGATLYAINQSHRTSDLRLLDVADPAAPREVGRFVVPGVQSVFDGVHDLHVIDHAGRRIAFLNALQSGLLILDVTDPAAIVTLSTVEWEGVFSHSGWAFEAGGRLYYANNDEGYDQGVRIFDVTDLAHPVLRSEYRSRPGISVHNVEVVGGIAYLSYYIDGLRVLDLRDPARPREIGHFDTVAPDQERDINQGAWGVHVDGGRVYISDRERGIYAFEVEVPPR